MAKFNIEYQTQHPAQNAYETIKKILSQGDDLKKYDSKIECSFNDKNMTCHIKGQQFKAELTVAQHKITNPPSAGSQVNILVDLPLLLMPFKSKVQESLTRMLSKHLGSE